jgi:hypothetical protein
MVKELNIRDLIPEDVKLKINRVDQPAGPV